MDWKRSDFYYKKKALIAMQKLVEAAVSKATYSVFSYSNEGHVSEAEWLAILAPYKVEIRKNEHGAYNGGKRKRGKEVYEFLYIVSARL